jgi:cholesterol oxidase
VTALRLAEKGWRVSVAEQGRRISPADMHAAKARPYTRLFWQPPWLSRGYFVQHLFRHVGIIGGVGLGGGSLVWAAVMLPPRPGFYAAAVWRRLGLDMQRELAPHLTRAAGMLGVTPNPRLTRQDDYLRATAARMGAAERFAAVPQAIYFGPPDETLPDPYFGGEGPARSGCRFCAGCISGCPYGAKNSLDQNYLYLAERRGARLLTQRRATRIEPLPGGGYALHLDSSAGAAPLRMTARHVVLAAGVVGTLELLLRAREIDRTLPRLSPRLGQGVRTNSEALTYVLSRDPDEDLSDGATLSSSFHADAHTHITQNRFDRAYRFVRWLALPMVDDPRPLRRALRTLLALFTRPRDSLTHLFARHYTRRLTALTVMQDDDSSLDFTLARPWWAPWRRRLASRPPRAGRRAPSYLPIANRATRIFAELSGGIPLSGAPEVLGDRAMTAHILGGCAMGVDAQDGVIDAGHQVHGHPGLFVVDASAIPANLGVNPSLTIAALAERFASLRPAAAQRGWTAIPRAPRYAPQRPRQHNSAATVRAEAGPNLRQRRP